jgi:hypothetical protein
MEVIEMPAGEPLPRVRERAPTPEPSEEDAPERFQTVPERLRADADCELEIESSEERAERQTLTTRILRYTAAFQVETESFKVSRKKLERRSLPALKELENDISHAVATRRTASALKSLFLAGVHVLEVGLPYAGLETQGLTGAVSRNADLLATVDEVAIKRDCAVAVSPEIRLLAGLGQTILAIDSHHRANRPVAAPAPAEPATAPAGGAFDDL